MVELPTLIYLYGPPAVGKLTVAEVLADTTGLPLFHNHLSVNAVRPIFGLGTPGYNAVTERLRIDVCATAIAEGRSLIFTNSSAWGGADGRTRFASFAARVVAAVDAAGGRTLLVQLVGDPQELETRVDSASRRSHHKLTDRERLREILSTFDASALPDTDLVVDTSSLDPREAAGRIAERYRAEPAVHPPTSR